MQEIVPSQSEYEKLIEEIHAAQARVLELTALRDDLLYHICPALRAEYEEKIGSLERELLAAQLYVRELQRTIEILQAQMNRQEDLDVEGAEQKAHEEYEEYQDELHRKAKEAEDFNNYWNNDTNWSRYGQDPKEEGPRPEDEQDSSAEESGPETKEAGDGTGSQTNGTGDPDEKEPGNGPEGSTDTGANSGSREQAATAGEAGKNFDPVAELKKLYKKIVKQLHPDVNPNITEREKELLDRAIKAYKAGDLEEMQRIWEELSSMDPPEKQYEDTPEGIGRLKELLAKLKTRIRDLEEEIRRIRSEFPYTMKAFLKDEAAVEEKRKQLQAQLDAAREMISQLTAYINELKAAYEKGQNE